MPPHNVVVDTTVWLTLQNTFHDDGTGECWRKLREYMTDEGII
jgi:hypothetical protein